MSDAKSISGVLANLILQENVPLRAVAVAGETIAADALLLDYPVEGTTRRNAFEDLGQFLETYETWLRRSEDIVSDFLRRRDGRELIRDLSEIKDALVELHCFSIAKQLDPK